MKIKKVSTRQFAGIHNKEIEFDDGINIVYGKNESGKSTIVNLISKTLFQDKKPAKGSSFITSFFPAETKDGLFGDNINGSVTIFSNNKEYSFYRKWRESKEVESELESESGTIENNEKIKKVRDEILRYGEGVYSEMLFSSQYNTDLSLQNILTPSENKQKKLNEKINAKDELADVVAKAFSESDGVSAEKIAEKINKKISELKGSYWDAENNRPTRSQRMQKNLGVVLPKYYDLEDAKNKLEELKDYECAVENTSAYFRKCDYEYSRLKEKYKKFNSYAGSLNALNQSKELYKSISEQIETIDRILIDWPSKKKNFNKAVSISNELSNRELLNKYQKAKILCGEYEEAKNDLSKLKNPSSEEISKVENAKNENIRLEASLCGMNLSAAVKMFGGNEIDITKVKTGEKIDVSAGNCEITESVKIVVPGIIEMQLSPKGVDVATVKDDIDRNNSIIFGIFEKYEVNSTEKLRDLQGEFKKACDKFEVIKRDFENALCGETFDELESKAAALPEMIRSKEEIESDILFLCGDNNIETFKTINGTVLERYVDNYGSIEKLLNEKAKKEEDRSKIEESIEMANNIPEEYRNIGELEELEGKVEQAEKECRNALSQKEKADGILENFNAENPDPVSAFDEAERAFNEQKELLAHWIHIEKVFNEVRENFRNNPMHDLAESFTKYLGIISGEKISSEFPDEEKLDMNIYSGNNKLDYDKLSEGTKETVSLAFRLAILDHLFPDGGGVIVFDDPFTDMDAERTAKSCELIKECAKKHQVIFLTCNEDYKEMLAGNIINI